MNYSGVSYLAILILVLAFWTCTTDKGPKTTANKRTNILFIAVDDLKPALGCYGDPKVHSPQIDKLAGEGTVFMLNYCQQSVCAPSRASLLTGRYPDQLRVWDLQTLIREKNPGIVTLPQYFKNQGYKTAATGKIFDPRSLEGSWGGPHDPPSWSFDYISPGELDTYNPETGRPSYFYAGREAREKIAALQREARDAGFSSPGDTRDYVKERYFPSVERAEVPFDAYTDGALCNHGLELMDSLADIDDPFFLAVGFHRPHLPFVAPAEYWDLYDRSDFTTADFQKQATNSPDLAYHNSGELRNGYTGIPSDSILPEELQLELIHGYYAATNFIDDMVGRLLDRLETLDLNDNTIVIVWGDHGWHLGDHGMWCKHSNFEQATRAPLIIRAPFQQYKGGKHYGPTEFTDIATTLCELAGLDIPPYFEGISLAPALDDPEVKIRESALSQYPREDMKYMGYTIRTGLYRLTKWIERETGKVRAVELYDYETDPLETINFADDPEYVKIRQSLDSILSKRIEDPASHH